jgi:hypothetical protein
MWGGHEFDREAIQRRSVVHGVAPDSFRLERTSQQERGVNQRQSVVPPDIPSHTTTTHRFGARANQKRSKRHSPERRWGGNADGAVWDADDSAPSAASRHPELHPHHPPREGQGSAARNAHTHHHNEFEDEDEDEMEVEEEATPLHDDADTLDMLQDHIEHLGTAIRQWDVYE